MTRYICCIFLSFLLCLSATGKDHIGNDLIENINNFDRNKLFEIFNAIKRNPTEEGTQNAEELLLKNDYKLTRNQSFYVKVNSANIILQSYRNGNYDKHYVIELIRKSMDEWLKSEDADVKRNAIDLLAYYDDRESFELLIQFISEQNEKYFSSALYSIYMLCASFDEARFKDVYKNLSERNRELADRFENGLKKNLKEAGWCSR